jgi:hypothetical protein
LDLRGRVDVFALAAHISTDQNAEQRERARSPPLQPPHGGGSGGSGATVALTKLVLALGLYPNVALRCPHNGGRPLAEHQFSTRQRGGLYLPPTCALSAASLDAAAAAVGSPGTRAARNQGEVKKMEGGGGECGWLYEIFVFLYLFWAG